MIHQRNSDEEDSATGDSMFDFYRCIALQDIGNIKKNDCFDWICVDMDKLKTRGYRHDENGNETMIFKFPFSFRLKL